MGNGRGKSHLKALPFVGSATTLSQKYASGAAFSRTRARPVGGTAGRREQGEAQAAAARATGAGGASRIGRWMRAAPTASTMSMYQTQS